MAHEQTLRTVALAKGEKALDAARKRHAAIDQKIKSAREVLNAYDRGSGFLRCRGMISDRNKGASDIKLRRNDNRPNNADQIKLYAAHHRLLLGQGVKACVHAGGGLQFVEEIVWGTPR